jgi:hypothetical protein
MAGFFGKLFGKKDSGKHSIKADTTPDLPIPFGYKNAWYAIKNETPESVIQKLELDILAQANWQSGMNHADSTNDVFVSPQIDGYVLVVGLFGITREDIGPDIIARHGSLFNNFQYFGTYRTVDYHAWAKFANGKPVRAYFFIGETGEIQWNEGAITPEEIELGLDKLVQSGEDFDNEDKDYPDEENVVDIAKAWGTDTLFEGKIYEKSTGYICSFNVT